jgi:type IV secretion system protein VirB2
VNIYSTRSRALRASAIGSLLFCQATCCCAQGLSKVNSLLQNLLTLLQGASAVIVAIAVIAVGYKMIFQQARWSEVSNIVIGALFIGGASSIASWLLG